MTRRTDAAFPILTVCCALIAFAVVRAVPQQVASPSVQGDAKIAALLSEMTLAEKIALLHGDKDPENLGQAGYAPGVARLGIPPMRLTDGPAGVRTGKPATALPAPVALASTFSPALAKEYGQTIGRDGAAMRQDVILAPMVNIVRVPQGGRNFETLGEDPYLASQLVAAEIAGIQGEGLIATVKHFAMNNQENARQSVSADVDEQTMHEIELPGFESAVRAGVGSVMAAYNKVNGTWSSENADLETRILRDQWGFKGFVMSDWGATHSTVGAITAGMEMEMPGGTYFTQLTAAVGAGQVKMAVIDEAVRRVLVQMDRMGWLSSSRIPRSAGSIARTSPAAREIAIAGAVLLKNDNHLLPLSLEDLRGAAVIGPTAKSLLVGGGGSARVPPMHVGSVVDELKRRRATASLTYAIGYDVEGDLVPVEALKLTGGPAGAAAIDFTGARALPAGSTTTWTGTMTAPATGDYEIHLQTGGGRGTIQFDPPPAPPADPAAAGAAGAAAAGRGAGRGGRGGGGGGAPLLPTALGLSNPTTTQHFDAGVPRNVTITGTAAATTPLEIRLAWVQPGQRDRKIKEAVEAARAAKVAIVFAYDEGSEGRDRASLDLPGGQNELIAAVAAANPRTVVVLNNGAPILMPWVDRVPAILQMWYPGQEGADATAAILVGDDAPGGRLPVTFPSQLADVPTNTPERYPGVDGHGAYSEGIFVGYRWYDDKNIAPLFPFGHGLSYTTFTYSNVAIKPAGDGYDVTFTVANTGAKAGTDVPQLYIGPTTPAPAPMALKKLAAFTRVTLAPGTSRTVTLHIGARELSYWSIDKHAWVLAAGRRTVMIGASSRDIRLRTEISR
jgi:beta-glucosidase